jgi:hypothetical protein
MGIFPHPQPLSKMERGENLPYRDGMGINGSFIFVECLN